MTEHTQAIAGLLDAVRARRERLVVARAIGRVGIALSVALLALLVFAAVAGRLPWLLAAIAAVSVLAVIGAFAFVLRVARHAPSDLRVARFIEERRPDLDERLVSAVGLTSATGDRPAFAGALLGDAARRASEIDPADIIPTDALRRAYLQAGVALLALAIVLVAGRHQMRHSFDALTLSLFPSRVHLEVTPGNARVQAGTALTVRARLVGNSTPVTAQIVQERTPDSEDWRAAEMTPDDQGFTTTLASLSQSFRYRVVAAGLTSETFTVAVLRPPRVKQIDLDYEYPKALGLAPRAEKDSGDIYAPANTEVRVSVHTDTPIASAQLKVGPGEVIDLTADASGRLLTGTLTVVEDSSYRVALADRDGMTSAGDTEYFIRMLDDRPPEVHVLRPASDRKVTPLEEVDIEAEAEDDYGVASMDLVYAVAGGTEKVVPLRIPDKSTKVGGTHTLYLEDLDVRPGDFVSYYVRARDLARGKRSSESRSDLFFLEIKPFEEEFTLAQSQAAQGGGAANPEIDDLVNAQKEVIVATWKLDRRAQTAGGAQSSQDVRAVGAAETELQTRVQQASSAFGTSRMRTPRRPAFGGGPTPPPAPGAPRAGQTLEEEDALTAAARAMGQAATHLNALKTDAAVAPEMEALNQLLRAQADVRKRQVQRQQAGAGSGGNRSGQDLSSLFDKELARQQQTNYETPTGASQPDREQTGSAIDKIKDLARRQDELAKQQQELARNQTVSEEERRRELAKLLRDQNELQKRAEELAQQMARQQGQGGQNSQPQSGAQSQAGQSQGQQGQQQAGQQPSGQQSGQQAGSQSGQQSGQQGRPGQSGQPKPGAQGSQQSASNNQAAGAQGNMQSRQLRQISEEMRNAAGELGRENAAEAGERSARAAEQLRQLEQQLQGNSPDARRRALGDLQLEARQLADAQRRIASDAARASQSQGQGQSHGQTEGQNSNQGQGQGQGQGQSQSASSSQSGQDTLRRLAGEQSRLADRLERVQQGLQQQSQPGGQSPGGKNSDASRRMQQAAGDSAQEMNRQRLTERMQQSAETMRGGGKGTGGGQEEIAKALDRIADRLSAATRSQDDDSQRLTENLSRVRELRDRLDSANRTLDQLNQQSAANGTRGQAPGSQPGQSTNPAGRPGDQAAAKPSGPAGAQGEGTERAPGQSGSGGSAADASLREQAERELREVRELIDQVQRDNQSIGQGGIGHTLAGQGMVLSAPGTEGFKQDFAKWQELSRQLTAALDRTESTLSGKLREKDAKDRLAAGADDRAPAQYQEQVDSYFKALASRATP